MKNSKKVIAAAVATSMMFSLVACGSKQNDAVIEAAETYTSALKDMKAKTIKKLSTEMEDEVYEEIEGMSESSFDKLIDAVMDKVEFEVNEKSIKINKDEASVKVDYTYVDIKSLDFDELDDLIDQIEDIDEDDLEKETLTLEFEIDDDEYLVSNADDVCTEFYETLFPLDDVETEIVEPVVEVDINFDNGMVFTVFSDYYFYDEGEDVEITVSYYGYDELNGEEIDVVVTDEDGNVVYTATCYYDGLEDEYLTVTGLEAGEYYISATMVNYNHTEEDDFEVYAVEETTPATTAAIVSGNGSYVNEELGIEFSYSDDLLIQDPSLAGIDDTGSSSDFVALSADNTFMVYTIIVDAEGGTVEDFIASVAGDDSIAYETVTINGDEFLYMNISGFFNCYLVESNGVYWSLWMADSTGAYANEMEEIANSLNLF